jgi:3-oxosteroid 1-dehydrogenase
MTTQYADIVVIGFGAAGACAAVEAHDSGATVILLEKAPEDRHYSNTRMSGGGFHSPSRDGDFESLKAYSKAMFSGENLPHKLEGEQPEFSDEIAELWAKLAPDNEPFMRSLDPQFKTVVSASAAFSHFPGAANSGYAVVRSTYTGVWDEALMSSTTAAAKSQKDSGEAFHACLLTGVQSRGIPIHYSTRADSFITNDDGAVIGVIALQGHVLRAACRDPHVRRFRIQRAHEKSFSRWAGHRRLGILRLA